MRIISRLLLFAIVCTSLHATQHTTPDIHSSPLFVANKGQWNNNVAYKVQSKGGTVWITRSGTAVFDYCVTETKNTLPLHLAVNDTLTHYGQVIKMGFDAANALPHVSGVDEQITQYNYLIGNDERAWVRGASAYKQVIVHNIYDGIDLRYMMEDGELRYDFMIQSGVDEKKIRLHFDGADRISLNAAGELVLATSIGDVVHKNLRCFAQIAGALQQLSCAYTLTSGNDVFFTVKDRDPSFPLVIDPIVWASYLGGNNIARTSPAIAINGGWDEIIMDVALDATNNIYATGRTSSGDFPTTAGAYQRTVSADPEVRIHAFVSKFSADGTTLVFSTYIGGNLEDRATAIALESSGAIVISGHTTSTNYPTTPGVYSRVIRGGQDGFVTKLNATGTSIIASTFVGSPHDDFFYDLAPMGTSFVVCGEAGDSTFPVTAGAYQTNTKNFPWLTAFVTILDANLQNITASTFLGTGTRAQSVAVDASNRVHVCGSTLDQSFPTTSDAFDRTFNGIIYDGFYSMFSANLSLLQYSTVFGGERDDFAYSLALDASGNAYVVGNTASNTFPTTVGAYDRSYSSRYFPIGTGPNAYDTTVYEGFVMKIVPGSNQLGYSTYLGGTNSEFPRRVFVDPNGNAVVMGYTYSPNFPVTDCSVDRSFNGETDGFVTILNSAGSSILYSSFMGSSGSDIAEACARASDGMLYIGGLTTAGSFPVTAGAFQTTRRRIDAFLLKYNPIPDVSVTAGTDIEFSCVTSGVNLDASPSCGTPPYTYLWSPGNKVSDSTAKSPFVNVAGATTPQEFVVTVTDAFGKQARNTVSVIPKLLKVYVGKDTVVCWGRTVRLKALTANGSGTLQYSWFGPGIVDPAASTTLAQPDTNARYIVIVRDSLGCEGSDTIDIVVSRPRYKATRDTVLCGGLDSVKLTSEIINGLPPYRYSWKSADGTELSTKASPTFKVTAPRTMFYLTLMDTLNCIMKDSVLVRMSPKMGIAIKGDTLICKGASTTLFATVTGGITPVAVRWTASDTSLAFQRGDTTATASLNATTTFTCYLTDAVGCVLTKNFTVKVDSLSNPKIKTAANKTAICDGEPLQLDAGQFANATYKWSNGATTQRITVNKAGTYAVTVTGKNGCAGSDSVKISENPKPTPKMAGKTNIFICEGDFTVLKTDKTYKSYKWSTGEVTPDISVKQTGVYYVTVTDSNGCTGSSDSATVGLVQVNATISGPNSVCINSDATYTTPSENGLQYVWSIQGSGGVITGGQGTNGLNVKWTNNGVDTIVLKVTDPRANCTVERRLIVTISSTLKPTILLNAKPVLCENASLKLSAPEGYTLYHWNTGATTREIDVTAAGKYAVYVEANGCSGVSDSVEVTQAPAPTPQITGLTAFCKGQSTTLQSTQVYPGMVWSSGETGQSITVRLAGTYILTVTDTNGCTGKTQVQVRERSVTIQNAASLGFGAVLITNTSSKTLSFTNQSGEDITIDDVLLDDPNNVFTISNVQPPLKSQVRDNQQLELTLDFKPLQEQSYTAKVRVIVNAPCPDTVEVEISGNGSRNDQNTIIAVVEMPQIHCDRAGIDTLLPVTLRLDPVAQYNNVSVDVRVSFDAALFYPNVNSPLTRGNLSSNTVVNGKRIMDISLDNISLTGKDELTAIRGIALVSSPDSTTLSPQVTWKGALQPKTSYIPGLLQVTACYAPGMKIGLSALAELFVTPNPAPGNVNITVRTGEPGEHRVVLYSQTGVQLYESNFVNGDSYREEQRMVGDIPSGVYICLLYSPFGMKSQKVTVVR